MSNELVGFFSIIMKDLDDRERMWEHYLEERPHEHVRCQHHLTAVNNIKTLTLNRARQFGLVVNNDPKMLKQEEEFGVVDMDAHKKKIRHLLPIKQLIYLGEY